MTDKATFHCSSFSARSLGVALLLLLSMSLAWAEEVTLNYKEADIREVANSISEVTGRNFIVDPRVKGRITVTSSRAIPPEAVYDTFLSILQVHGFAAMESGNTVKIVPSSDARQMPGGELSLSDGEFSDEIETRVIELEHVPAAQLVPILRPLVPQHSHLAAVNVSNMIVIADRRANIERVRQLINRIDRAKDDEIEVIRLEHASANEVVRVLSSMERRDRGDGSAPLSLVADERSNSVLLGGASSDRLRMRALISHLDTPMEEGGNSKVHYLHYSDATTMADVLRSHVEDGASERDEDRVSIVADEGTNSLVLTAPPRQMREITSVIEKLDIRRAQVLVEAIIVEVSEDRTGELGVTWAAMDEDGSNPFGLTRFPQSGADIGTIGGAAAAGASEQALQSMGDGLVFGLGRTRAGGLDFAALFRALAGDSKTNILSTPTLLTMDNEEAEITVGQQVPFLTGSYSNVGGGGQRGDQRDGQQPGGGAGMVNPFQTIQREDVGITLKITPRINEGDAVFLDIEQEVSSIAGGVSGAADLITNRRAINTRVIVEDGEVIVLGGLIDEQLREQEQRVPILGSIPVLGNLFKSTSTDSEKRNLMVFLKPMILRGPDDARHYTEAKYTRMRDLQEGDTDRVPRVHGVERPRLEPLEQFRRTPHHDDEGRTRGRAPHLDLEDEDEAGNGEQ
ncbi:general secretion pathway protein D [Natronospira proteinivora]|uniref:General secretion pathway protein D n=1 Tax=Natronospira proteinivora TaxID=1807133 RepID=A0ABT1G5Z5_9GAMM|nr:type II secretion system secretin GspD [Natronospira proteinivora]MCP1726722.1 general secretion pathway protein D [Natronospira proteinivora]